MSSSVWLTRVLGTALLLAIMHQPTSAPRPWTLAQLSPDPITEATRPPVIARRTMTTPSPGSSPAPNSSPGTGISVAPTDLWTEPSPSPTVPETIDPTASGVWLSGDAVPGSVAVGDAAIVRLTAHNDSNATVPSVVVSVALPPELSVTNDAPDYDVASAVWTLPDLPPGVTLPVDLRVRVGSAGPHTLVARANNGISVNVRIRGLADQTYAAPAATSGIGPMRMHVDTTPAVLIGTGIVLLSVLMLLILIVRARAESG